MSYIKKLALLCPNNGHCHGFLVILDRCITDDIAKNLQDEFNRLGSKRVQIYGLNI